MTKKIAMIIMITIATTITIKYVKVYSPFNHRSSKLLVSDIFTVLVVKGGWTMGRVGNKGAGSKVNVKGQGQTSHRRTRDKQVAPLGDRSRSSRSNVT